MTSLGATRSTVVAIGLALLTLVTVTGLAGAALSGGPAATLSPGWARLPVGVAGMATVTGTLTATGTATAAETLTVTATAVSPATIAPSSTLTPTATATPSPTPSPTARPPGPSCRVAGSALVPDVAGGGLYWSRVQNSGPVTVTLRAIQAGWGGEFSLAQVLVRPAGPDALVFGGLATSPALVTLAAPAGRDGVVRLAPGQALDLGLRFAPLAGAPAGTLVPGPVVLFTAEGCLATLAAAPLAAECGLSAAGPRPDVSEPSAVVVSVTNRGASVQDVAALELRWPVAEAGQLVAVRWGVGPEVPVPAGLGDASPAILDLGRLLGAPARPDPGATVDLRLRFARPAPPQPYTVVLTSRQGCLSTATTWVGAAECGVAAQGFETGGVTARLRLFNRRAVTRTLGALTLFWPATPNGPLVGVALDGRPVWTGQQTRSPAVVVLPADTYLAPDRASEVQLTFRPPSGAPNAPRTVASGDYTVVAWLRGACPVTFSTASGQLLQCSVSAGDWQTVDERHAAVRLTNAGAEATLRRLTLSWPRKNGNLVGVWLAGVSLFNGVAEPSASAFALTFLPGRGAVLPRNDTRELLLSFDRRAVSGGYSASLQFDDPAGSPCSDILVTSRPAEVECSLTLSGLRIQEAIHAELTVDNAGPDELEIDSLTVDWGENPWRLVNLVQAAVLSGGEVNVIWTGQQFDSPATIRPNTATLPLLPARSRATLRLRFGHVLDMPDPERVIKVSLATAEGCHAGYAADGDPAPPQFASFAGVIRQLPAIGNPFGTWQVDTDQGLRLVEVDRNTRFSPDSMAPRVGDAVHVRALVANEGFYAQEITFTHPETYETLEGVLEALGEGDPPAWVTLKGERLAVAPDAEIRGHLELGAAVTVWTRRSGDGKAVALAITVRTPPAGEPFSFTGLVQAARAEADAQVWEVDRFAVRVLAGTLVRPAPEPPGSLPAAGKRVQVVGRLDGEVVTASEVTILPDPVVENMVGTIKTMPTTGGLGLWEADVIGRGRVRFMVTSPSVVDTRVAPAAPDMRVYLRLQDLGDGSWMALRVRVDWPD